jgi:O-antigen/teichoic acid export membrane protein
MIKLLLKDTVVFGLGNAVKKLIGLFLLPFYTHALAPEDYGVLETMGVFVFFVTAVLDFGLNTGSARYYFQAPNDQEKGRVLFTALVMRLVSIIPSLILAINSSSISQYFFNTEEYTWVVFLSCISIPMTMLNQEQVNLLRYLRQPWSYNILTLLRALMGICLGISLVVILKKGAAGAQMASLISSSLIFFISYLFINRKRYVYSFSWYWGKKMLLFGFPLIWASIALWFFEVSDRYVILYFHNSDQIGLYSIASRVTQVLILLNMAINMSFKPLILQSYEEEKLVGKPISKSLISQTFGLYGVVAGIIASIISIFSFEIISLLAPESYLAASVAVPGLIFGSMFFQSRAISAIGIGLKEKTKWLMYTLVLAALLNIGLNFWLIPEYSFFGASLTTMISSLFYFFLSSYLSNRLFAVKLPVIRMMSYWFICLFFSFVVILDLLPMFNKLLLQVLFLLLVCLMPFVMRLVSISQLKSMLAK